MRIGIIGLGLLGGAIAQRLIAEGYEVSGYDIKEAARETAAASGVDVRASAAEVAQSGSILLLSLMNSDDRRRLFWSEQDLAEHLRPGTLILDTTTADPEDIRADHAALAKLDARLVDVCISGSSQAVAQGRALALVGDTEEDAVGYQQIVGAFTKRQYFLGGPGRGNEAKLVVNIVMGLNRLVLAEALGLARAGGFDLTQMLEILKEGDSYTTAMDTKGPQMVERRYEPPVARLEQHAKDVRLILDYAARSGVDLPVSGLHRELIERAVENGLGALDNTAIFELYT